jgi:hypothetical protein
LPDNNHRIAALAPDSGETVQGGSKHNNVLTARVEVGRFAFRKLGKLLAQNGIFLKKRGA